LGEGLCPCNLRESLTGFAQGIEGAVAVLPFEFNSDFHSSPLGWWVILKAPTREASSIKHRLTGIVGVDPKHRIQRVLLLRVQQLDQLRGRLRRKGCRVYQPLERGSRHPHW